MLVLEVRHDDSHLISSSLWGVKNFKHDRRRWKSISFLVIKLLQVDVIYIMEIPHVEEVSLDEAEVLLLANRQLLLDC